MFKKACALETKLACIEIKKKQVKVTKSLWIHLE